MIICRTHAQNVQLKLNDKNIERTKRFKYLGFLVTENPEPDIEIKKRICITHFSFITMKSMFCNNSWNVIPRRQLV